jgi:hypothetical protein
MGRNGGNWLQLLRTRLGVGEVGIDLLALVEHPDSVIRVLAAGVVWGRTGGRQPALVLPHIEVAIRSGDLSGLVFGCQLLSEMGPSAGDIVPLVWALLRHSDWGVRLNAACAICKCCRDRRVLDETAALIEAEISTGGGLANAAFRSVAERLRRAAEFAPCATLDRSHGRVSSACVAFSLSWRTATAMALARQIDESGDFSAMPILADALQDAGCEDEHILKHCRGSGPHVRGCWVVDLVLAGE